MAQPTLIEIFAICVERLEAGDSIERCLASYPSQAAQLRPLLNTVQTLRRIEVSQSEIAQDKVLVWNQLQARLQAPPQRSGRGTRIVAQLLAAVKAP